MTNSPQSAVIVGGGISGLTSALALAREGIDCNVIEKYERRFDVGAGIQLTPNATGCLYQLGLEMDLAFFARIPQVMEWLDGETDQLLAQFQLGDAICKRYGTPLLQISRSDLIKILEAACKQSKHVEVNQGITTERLNLTPEIVEVITTSGSMSTNLCIGADGTNSMVRSYANCTLPSHHVAGCAYRATIPFTQLRERDTRSATRVWLHEKFHVVTYPVGVTPVLNCVFVIDTNDHDNKNDLHRQKASRHELRQALAEGSPNLRELIDLVDETSLYRWPLYQFSPIRVRQATRYPIALVGDAWHTTLPFAAQGAALAIEDAVEIAKCLRLPQSTSVNQKLTLYEKRRIPRIRRVQSISSRNRTLYHLQNELLRRIRNWGAQIGFEWVSRQLFSYQATEFD